MRDDTAPIANLDALEPRPRPDALRPPGAAAGRFAMRQARFSAALGARKLGYNLTELPPGMAAYPHHSHRVNEEMFLIISGRGELRLGDERYPVGPMDVIACPPGGPQFAHQLRNTGSERVSRNVASSDLARKNVMKKRSLVAQMSILKSVLTRPDRAQ